MTTTVTIKKGWIVKKTKDKDGESIVATKKFFEPKDNGYSCGSIEYTASFKSNKNKKATNVELEDSDI
jgi:hypothetical protein